MYLTEKLAISLGKKARILLNVDKNREQIIVYGAINLLQTIFSISWIAIAGFILGVLYEALIFSTTASILRKYSGGVHASSPNRCIIIGTVLSSASGLVIDKFSYNISLTTTTAMGMFFITASFTIVMLKAPVDSIKKPITDLNMKKRFKKNSIVTLTVFSMVVVILSTLYESTLKLYYLKIIHSIILGILWQSFTLTKMGITIFEKVDFILKSITERS
ncbi:accessory gene regulator ArgB-like protein [Clostridium kluyveri]|uniref:accessory gene regulator ArgB-like protein n=1 Tax=Clostridium kluyveri TaxID=1534 RepID=UPI002245D26D|nr:accessory gene regulator B family protein [Clostridium kluyveri]UZQ49405.1 accessory gene regulator B family protein [Clostridium kluyveri]